MGVDDNGLEWCGICGGGPDSGDPCDLCERDEKAALAELNRATPPAATEGLTNEQREAVEDIIAGGIVCAFDFARGDLVLMLHRADGSRSGGVGLGGLVFVVFLVLKLLGKISWSWWWVTAPLWGPLALFLGLVIIVTPIYLWVKS